MPEISRFLGIKIFIYYNEHNPPHFHATYAGKKAVFSIKDLRLMEGGLPERVITLILEWAFINREALLEDWGLAQKKAKLNKIKGLV